SATRIHGLTSICFMPSEISCLPLLISRTTTSTWSPTLTISDGWLMRRAPLASLSRTSASAPPPRPPHSRGVAALVVQPSCPPPDGVAVVDRIPRIFLGLLETQGDLFLVLVDVENLDFHFLIDLEQLAGVADAVPAHVGDVEQAVDAAQIHERAEVGDVLDD